MKLIFLSNTRNNPSAEIKDEIKKRLSEAKTIAYIPTSADSTRKYFNEVQEFFSSFSDYKLKYFGLFNGEWNENFIEEISKCDAIFISGGNTYNLLYHLKLRKLEKLISEFAKYKYVMGVSAGGIVLTPSIDISSSENEMNLQDSTSLGLVPFYFYPHFVENEEYTDELKEFQTNNKEAEIYLVSDQSAIFVENEKLKTIGDIIKIKQS